VGANAGRGRSRGRRRSRGRARGKDWGRAKGKGSRAVLTQQLCRSLRGQFQGQHFLDGAWCHCSNAGARKSSLSAQL